MFRVSRLISFFLLLLISTCVIAQDPVIKFTEVKVDPKKNSTGKILFPVFTFKNSVVGKRINAMLLDDLKKFFDNNKQASLKEILRSAVNDGLGDLRYDLIRNDSRLFAFVIGLETMGAYPSFSQWFYSFEKKTGRPITIDSLIMTSKMDEFMKLFKSKQHALIQEHYADIQAQIDSGDYEKDDLDFVKEQTKDDCMEFYDPNKFLFHPNGIEIIMDCEFAHAFKAMQPYKYPFFTKKELLPYLKEKYLPYLK